MIELLGDAPDRRVELICEHDDVHATLSRYGPGRAGADLHVHHEHTDIFHVLDGELTVLLGDEEDVVIGPGELVHVPPNVVHGFGNRSDADVRFLNFHVPPCGFADYMRGLRDGVKVPFDQHPPS